MLNGFKMLEMIYSGLSIVVVLFLLLLEKMRRSNNNSPNELQIIATEFVERLCIVWFILSFVILYQITFY